MPIRPELRKFYTGPAWDQARASILQRARKQCEDCGKPQGKLVYVTRDGTGRWNSEITLGYQNARLLVTRVRKELAGKRRFEARWNAWYGPGKNTAPAPESGYIYCIRVVLSIAHLNHTPGDDRPENLKALCLGCHLRYDREYHKLQRSIRKDTARPVFESIGQAALEVR